jgi:LPXTG-site transpeptidase (sortase) family protein
MATARFKKTLTIRFIAYLCLILSIGGLIFQFGPVGVAEFNYRKDLVLGVKHTVSPTVVTSASLGNRTATDSGQTTGFGDIQVSESLIKPVSTEFGIVIEKINANAKVIPNIDPGNERQYGRALAEGVAAAQGSTVPGEPGNLFLFSHSIDAPWNVARFNAVFYLLRELNPGDRIIIYYQGRRYDYIVFDRQIVAPHDISFLANRYDQPVLTLQTCDPPGTLLNRLIVRAKLLGS